MYVVVAIGLVLLWRGRSQFSAPGVDRMLFANALMGFGAWHVVDAVLSHWVLGIHRIRMDVDNPLVWDLMWLAVFGLLPLAAGIMMRRRRSDASRLMSAPLALAAAVAITAPLAALPPSDETTTMVMFRPGIEAHEAFNALMAAEARLIWSDPSQQVWAVELPVNADRAQLYAQGALLISQSILPAGWIDWISA